MDRKIFGAHLRRHAFELDSLHVLQVEQWTVRSRHQTVAATTLQIALQRTQTHHVEPIAAGGEAESVVVDEGNQLDAGLEALAIRTEGRGAEDVFLTAVLLRDHHYPGPCDVRLGVGERTVGVPGGGLSLSAHQSHVLRGQSARWRPSTIRSRTADSSAIQFQDYLVLGRLSDKQRNQEEGDPIYRPTMETHPKAVSFKVGMDNVIYSEMYMHERLSAYYSTGR